MSMPRFIESSFPAVRTQTAADRRAAPSPKHNRLLAALPPDIQNRLFPHLELTTLPFGAVLHEPANSLRHVYFPTDCTVALLYVTQGGASAEFAVVGNEGIVGVAAFMGDESGTREAVVQCPGHAYRLPAQRLTDEFGRHNGLLRLMLRYTQALITQIAQTAVCNRHHSVDQHLCRWLLLSLDRLPTDRLAITQEQISDMLGVRREAISAAARRLQCMGVISYARGHIIVLDRPQLEQLCCECYAVVKNESDRLLPIG